MNLMTTDELILTMLATMDEAYGLTLVKANPKLKRGTIYVHLESLVERGLVVSRQEKHTPPHIEIPRKLYRLASKPEPVSE